MRLPAGRWHCPHLLQAVCGMNMKLLGVRPPALGYRPERMTSCHLSSQPPSPCPDPQGCLLVPSLSPGSSGNFSARMKTNVEISCTCYLHVQTLSRKPHTGHPLVTSDTYPTGEEPRKPRKSGNVGPDHRAHGWCVAELGPPGQAAPAAGGAGTRGGFTPHRAAPAVAQSSDPCITGTLPA